MQDGCPSPETSQILGDNTFSSLVLTSNSGKTFEFESGKTQSVMQAVTLMGTLENFLVLQSTESGIAGNLDLSSSASQTINYISVNDNYATGQTLAPTGGGNQVIYGQNIRGWGAAFSIPSLSLFGMVLLALTLLISTRKFRFSSPI